MKPLILSVFLLAPAASAQLISVGIRGGVPFTNAFADITEIPPGRRSI